MKDVKSIILRREGVPMHKQQLTFSGIILNDEKPLSFYHITGSSLIESRVCHFTSGQIFVKTPSRRTVTLAVSDTDTVQSVKEKLAEREGISVDEQRLLYAGKQLEGAETLSQYGVKKDSTLDLSLALRGGMMIHMRVWSPTAPETTFTLMKIAVSASDTIENVKEEALKFRSELQAVNYQLYISQW